MIYAFSQYLLSTYYVPGIVLHTEYRAANKTQSRFNPCCYIGKVQNKSKNQTQSYFLSHKNVAVESDVALFRCVHGQGYCLKPFIFSSSGRLPLLEFYPQAQWRCCDFSLREKNQGHFFPAFNAAMCQQWPSPCDTRCWWQPFSSSSKVRRVMLT